MSASAYEPEIYEQFFADRTSDVGWYLSLARRLGGPVLELGAGTGRTLLPVAAAGIDITGVEPAPEMRAYLQHRLDREPAAARERVRLVAGEMSTFADPGAYRLVQIPFRTFLHNLDTAAQLATLRQSRANLMPGGTLAFDVFNPSLDYMASWQGSFEGIWRLSDERRRPDGSLVLLSETVSFDGGRQTLRALHRYERYGGDGRAAGGYMQILELAYLFAGDVRALLIEAGFADIQIAGGFSHPPPDPADDLVVTARRDDSGGRDAG